MKRCNIAIILACVILLVMLVVSYEHEAYSNIDKRRLSDAKLIHTMEESFKQNKDSYKSFKRAYPDADATEYYDVRKTCKDGCSAMDIYDVID